MQDDIEERAKEYQEVQEELQSKQKELKEIQTGVFGTESEDAEERARQFFSSNSRDSGSGQTERIDNLREEVSELEEEMANAKENFLERLVDLQLPFEEVIEPKDETVEFPFSESFAVEVIEAVEDVLKEDLREGDVKITTDALIVQTSEVEEAIDLAEDRIDELRTNAGTKVDIDEYLEELHNRDEKVALTLYTLYEEQPLTKKEIESRMGVEPGTLRGQLYYVLDNDPYLKKEDKKFSLTETGREVIEGFVEEHGEPEPLEQSQEVKQ